MKETTKRRGPKDKGLKRRLTIMLTDEEFARIENNCPNHKMGQFVRYCIEQVIGKTNDR